MARRLTDAQILDIRSGEKTNKEYGEKYGISANYVSFVRANMKLSTELKKANTKTEQLAMETKPAEAAPQTTKPVLADPETLMKQVQDTFHTLQAAAKTAEARIIEGISEQDAIIIRKWVQEGVSISRADALVRAALSCQPQPSQPSKPVTQDEPPQTKPRGPLTAEEKNDIQRRILAGETNVQIAKIHGISSSRVSQLRNPKKPKRKRKAHAA